MRKEGCAFENREEKNEAKERGVGEDPLPVGQLCLLFAGCCYPLVTIKMKCPSAAIFTVWPICF